MLFNEHDANGPLSGLSNEVLCILAAQGAANLLAVKNHIRGIHRHGFKFFGPQTSEARTFSAP